MADCSSGSHFANCVRLLTSDDIPGARVWLREHPEVLAQLPASVDILRPLSHVRSPEMVDLLVDHGFEPDRLSTAWAPGFGLDKIPSKVAQRWVTRGVRVSPHAASALGLLGELAEQLDSNPALVHAPGGDGCRPLHFARTVEVASLLLERGANIDVRDEDHDSTAAQWRIGESPEVTRFLLNRGATPDVFMAAGLGDLSLARQRVDVNPACAAYRIGNNSGPFPGIGFNARGGTIYQWTLGFNQSAQEIANRRGHVEVFDFLMNHTPPPAKILIACALCNEGLARQVLAENPGLVGRLTREDYSLVAKFCWETNIDINAVRLMLDLGFPVDTPESNHGYTPLHNAAWCGHAELVELLIQRGHPLSDPDPAHHATPMDWAIHSCLEARRHPEGDFPRVLELLLLAGGKAAKRHYPTGREDLDSVLRRFGTM